MVAAAAYVLAKVVFLGPERLIVPHVGFIENTLQLLPFFEFAAGHQGIQPGRSGSNNVLGHHVCHLSLLIPLGGHVECLLGRKFVGGRREPVLGITDAVHRGHVGIRGALPVARIGEGIDQVLAHGCLIYIKTLITV